MLVNNFTFENKFISTHTCVHTYTHTHTADLQIHMVNSESEERDEGF